MLSKLDSFILHTAKVVLSVAYIAFISTVLVLALTAAAVGLMQFLSAAPIYPFSHIGSQMLWLLWTTSSMYMTWSIIWGALLNANKANWTWFMRKLWDNGEK